jgi:hypothetical protein
MPLTPHSPNLRPSSRWAVYYPSSTLTSNLIKIVGRPASNVANYTEPLQCVCKYSHTAWSRPTSWKRRCYVRKKSSVKQWILLHCWDTENCIRLQLHNNNNNNNNNNKLQFGCHPVAVVISHVTNIWSWLLVHLTLSLESYMRST